MGLDHKTSEPFALKGGRKQGSDTVMGASDRLIAVRGASFYRDFLSGMIQPTRRDVATMALQQLLAKAQPGELVHADTIVQSAFAIADAFCMHEAPSLEAKLSEYFDLFMKRGNLDQILKDQIDAAKDYSL